MCRKMKLDHFLTPHTRINSEWNSETIFRPETIKTVQENIAKSQALLVAIFYWMYLPRRGNKGENKTKQMGLHQIKEFLHSKGNH